MPWATRPIRIVFKSHQAGKATEEKLRLLKQFKASRDWDILHEDEAVLSGPHLHHPFSNEEVSGQWREIDRAIDEAENKRVKERSLPFTVLDYLTLQQPRTTQREALAGRLIPGHKLEPRETAFEIVKQMPPIDWKDVDFVDWWGDHMSYQGKMLRVNDRSKRVCKRMSTASTEMCFFEQPSLSSLASS